MEIEWLDLAVGAGMFGMMFAMGLTLAPADFERIVARPRATVVGIVLQLLVMPIVGIGLANVFSLSPLLSAGIVIIAACPGGTFSNMYIHVAKGNTALSITLTAAATMITLFTLPLWVQFALAAFSEGVHDPVEMPILETALRLSFLTVVPVLLGMGVRHRWPEKLAWERRITPVAVVIMISSFIYDAGRRPELPIEEFLSTIIPAGCFALAAIFVGLVVPTLLRVSPRETVTIAVELVVKNTLLGIVLVGQALDFEAALPIFAFALFQTPAGIILLVAWRFLEKKGWISGEADENLTRSDATRARQTSP